jgi:NADH-quinone oxidoreductase subunit K
MVPLTWYLVVAAILFRHRRVWRVGAQERVAILMGVELMLNAVNINLVAFWRYLQPDKIVGQAFAAFVFVVAAAEAYLTVGQKARAVDAARQAPNFAATNRSWCRLRSF